MTSNTTSRESIPLDDLLEKDEVQLRPVDLLQNLQVMELEAG